MLEIPKHTRRIRVGQMMALEEEIVLALERQGSLLERSVELLRPRTADLGRQPIIVGLPEGLVDRDVLQVLRDQLPKLMVGVREMGAGV